VSARKRYFWGSVERAVEARQAKRIVARRPVESWITVRRTAGRLVVGFWRGLGTCARCG
jgi:hypothetical protein